MDLGLRRRRGRPPSRTDGATEAVEAIRALKNLHSLTERELAERAGIDQSSVNRALARTPAAWTPSLRRLWSYAEKIHAVRPQVPETPEAGEKLATAAMAAWDGTDAGLVRLLRLLEALRAYRDPDPDVGPPPSCGA